MTRKQGEWSRRPPTRSTSSSEACRSTHLGLPRVGHADTAVDRRDGPCPMTRPGYRPAAPSRRADVLLFLLSLCPTGPFLPRLGLTVAPQDRGRGDPGRLAAHHLLSAGRSGARHADVDPVAVDRHDLLATGTHTLRQAGAGLSASPRRPGPDPGHRGPTPEARTWLSVPWPAARRPSLATAENREPRLASFAVGARDFR